MKKTISIVLSVLFVMSCVFALASCSGSKDETTVAPDTTAGDETTTAAEAVADVDYITGKGTLIVGITDYAPMDYKDDNGKWIGFDAEYAEAVAAKLGVTVEFKEIDWDNKVLELNSKAIDCVWNGMTISDDVKAAMSITDAYVKNAQVIIMKADKAADYKDVASMKDLSFAVEAGSAGKDAAEDNGFKYTAVNAQSDALMEVNSGSADACIIDLTMANAMTGEGTSYANLKSVLSLSEEEYGIGCRMGSDLTAKINEITKVLAEDGTMAKIAEKYSLTLTF